MFAWIIIIIIIIIIGMASGFILFRKNIVPAPRRDDCGTHKLSVIIPARNEQLNLPHLLDSLQNQTSPPYEIIVVDDGSEDGTRAIAECYGVSVIAGTALPPGWTGKNWAVWNGYHYATGTLLLFLDTDVRLAPDALEALIQTHAQTGGAISVVPFHHTEKWFERLSLIFNVASVFAFTSFFEKKSVQRGLYGSCIMAARNDYERIGGHESVKGEVLDDMKLGACFASSGIPVNNFIGYGIVSFRMYPGGVRSIIEGYSKSAALGVAALRLPTVLLNALWIVGLLASEAFLFLLHTPFALPLAAGYLFYTLQLLYFSKFIGRFGKTLPILHVIPALFFVGVMLYSVYQVLFLGHVAWKGRNVKIGGNHDQ